MFQKVVIAGFVATLLMSLVGYFVPPMLGQEKSDSGKMLGELIFKGPDNEMMAMIAGWMMHFIMGAVVLAFIYASVLYGVLPGDGMIKGVIWGVVLYMLWGVMIMPMMPSMMNGTIGFDTTKFFAGDIIGPMSMWSLITHAIYGLALGMIYKPD